MDYYSEDQARLDRQPKRTIADYAERNGILAPRRFDSIREARMAGFDDSQIFLRSEHPHEYDGASGILDSFRLGDNPYFNKKVDSLTQVKQMFFDANNGIGSDPKYKIYCQILGIDEQDFRDETSFSVWEYIDGPRMVVVADSSIKNRYHIMAQDLKDGKVSHDYLVFDREKGGRGFTYNNSSKGKVEKVRDLSLTEAKLLDVYEQVRNLEHFDPNHCPIMEFAGHDTDIYFLQYHRTRDFQERTFVLGRNANRDESEALFARGASKEGGETFRVIAVDRAFLNGGLEINENAEGFIGVGAYHPLREIMYKRSFLQIKNVRENDLVFHMHNITRGHSSRSAVFKPKIYSIHDNDGVLSKKEKEELWGKASKTDETQYVDLHVESDGDRSLIKRVG